MLIFLNLLEEKLVCVVVRNVKRMGFVIKHLMVKVADIRLERSGKNGVADLVLPRDRRVV